ncbi:molybdopterin molybdotransferase MoeA [Hyphococcus lacteus]|uniref:Molybdopterin molybdenumtransferase n=1 Tax=Hyphococcus lacteus TaxID=3143536 RepID=A0ABV3ZA91_9PROT
MISVDEAIDHILSGVTSIGAEFVSLSALPGRIAASDVIAHMTQPPFSASAMDGYAVQFSSAGQGAVLSIIGEAPAGVPFDGCVGPNEAVRIFTGGVVPEGANHVIIQEDVVRECDVIRVNSEQQSPAHIRPAGVDFQSGDVIVGEGTRFHEIHGAICAAANIGKVSVRRRPKVALFSNGDELVEPGSELTSGQIVNANHFALSAMIKRWGGEPIYLGCAPDDEAALCRFFERGQDADIIVPIGGASVGDYDFVKSAFAAVGGTIVFSKIAVRPGKPTWFGNIDKTRVIGLPGNPASAIVTAALFLQPLVRKLAGEDFKSAREIASLKEAIAANGARESYLRAQMFETDNKLEVVASPNQDSSLLLPFDLADALIRCPANASALSAGHEVEIIRLR